MSTLLPPSPLGNEHTTALLPSGNAHAAATSLASASLSARFSAPELPSSLDTAFAVLLLLSAPTPGTLEAGDAAGDPVCARLRAKLAVAADAAVGAAFAAGGGGFVSAGPLELERLRHR